MHLHLHLLRVLKPAIICHQCSPHLQRAGRLRAAGGSCAQHGRAGAALAVGRARTLLVPCMHAVLAGACGMLHCTSAACVTASLNAKSNTSDASAEESCDKRGADLGFLCLSCPITLAALLLGRPAAAAQQSWPVLPALLSCCSSCCCQMLHWHGCARLARRPPCRCTLGQRGCWCSPAGPLCPTALQCPALQAPLWCMLRRSSKRQSSRGSMRRRRCSRSGMLRSTRAGQPRRSWPGAAPAPGRGWPRPTRCSPPATVEG